MDQKACPDSAMNGPTTVVEERQKYLDRLTEKNGQLWQQIEICYQKSRQTNDDRADIDSRHTQGGSDSDGATSDSSIPTKLPPLLEVIQRCNRKQVSKLEKDTFAESILASYSQAVRYNQTLRAAISNTEKRIDSLVDHNSYTMDLHFKLQALRQSLDLENDDYTARPKATAVSLRQDLLHVAQVLEKDCKKRRQEPIMATVIVDVINELVKRRAQTNDTRTYLQIDQSSDSEAAKVFELLERIHVTERSTNDSSMVRLVDYRDNV